MQFQSRSNKLWVPGAGRGHRLLLDFTPSLVESYRVYGEKPFSRYKMRTAQATIMAEVRSNEKRQVVSLDISVDYEGQTLPLEKSGRPGCGASVMCSSRTDPIPACRKPGLKSFRTSSRPLGLTRASRRSKSSSSSKLRCWTASWKICPMPARIPSGTSCAKNQHFSAKSSPLRRQKGLNASLRGYQSQGLSYLNFLSGIRLWRHPGR